MVHPDSREGLRISRFHPQMSSFHPPQGSIFKPAPSCPQLGRLAGPQTGKCADMAKACARFYMPMTMIEKLAMNMAMEVKAARSRMKSVIGRLPFPLCSYNVLFTFMRQAATANLSPQEKGDGKQCLTSRRQSYPASGRRRGGRLVCLTIQIGE
jgi:hypothetical protein